MSPKKIEITTTVNELVSELCLLDCIDSMGPNLVIFKQGLIKEYIKYRKNEVEELIELAED